VLFPSPEVAGDKSFFLKKKPGRRRKRGKKKEERREGEVTNYGRRA